MYRLIPTLTAVIILLAGLAGAKPAPPTQSLVPPAAWQTDEEARLQLADLWANEPAHQADALALLERVIDDRPTNLEARFRLADLLIRQGRKVEANSHLDVIQAHREDSVVQPSRLADLLIRAGRLPEALIALREAVQLDSSDPHLLLQLAEVALWTGEVEEAQATLRRLHPLPSTLAWRVADLEGQLALRAGHLEDAEAAWRRALAELADPALPLDPLARQTARRTFHRQVALVIGWRDLTEQALPALEAILADNPTDDEVRRELGRQYLRASNPASAEATICPLIEGPHPCAADLALWGDIHLNQGRIRSFLDTYERALASSPESATSGLKRRWADALRAAGDLARALKVYQELLASAPADLDLGMALAWCLASAERYPEARQACAQLRLAWPDTPRLDLLEARIRLLEKDFEGCLALSSPANRASGPAALETRILRAEAWLGLAQPASAAAELVGLPLDFRIDDPHPIERLVDLQRLLDLTGQASAAERLLECLERQRPRHPNLQLARWIRQYPTDHSAFARMITLNQEASPSHLAQWGHLLMGRQRLKGAEAAFRQALRRQPDCLPARLGLVMLLAATERRREASLILEPARRDLPDHFLIRLWHARLLAWDRRYDEARRAYIALREADPDDPVAQRESARLAFWAKRPGEARTLYGMRRRPAADTQIADWLQKEGLSVDLGSSLDRPPDWDGWDRLNALLRDPPATLSPDMKAALENIRTATLADARQQKLFDLEERAKRAVWEGRLQASLPLFRRVLALEPGNLECRFDLSQVQNRLGLRDHEAASYREILRLDPLHSLVRHAQRKHQVARHPLVRALFDQWREEGRGELARMSRWRWRLEGETPVGPRWRLAFGQNRWKYHSDLWGRTFQATGPTLTLRGVANPWVKAEAGWERQEFAGHREFPNQPIPERDSGYARVQVALLDRLEIGLGLDRVNQFVNEIGVRDGVQARQRWLSAAWSATRRWLLHGRWTRQNFTDSNHGRLFEWETGFQVSDHPRRLRVILSGDTRDVDRSSVFLTRQGRLVNIIHPYWTPRSYQSRALTLHYQADLSKRLLASTDHHLVDAWLTRGNDTDDSHATRFELSWQYEFDRRWAVELRGMMHRSRNWDASSYGFFMHRNF